jgi:hypothetical protein
MSTTNVEVMKERVPSVKDMILSVLKVRAGNQSTLDIIAVSNGIKDFNTAKGLSKQPQYSAQTNLGFDEYPCFMEEQLGTFESDHLAYEAMVSFLHKVKKNMKWVLLKDGQPTGIREVSGNIPEKGLYVEVMVTGKTLSDVEIALDIAKGEIESEFNRGSHRSESNSVDYVVSGSSFDVIAEAHDFVRTSDNEFLIVDEDKVLFATESLDEADTKWAQYLNDEVDGAEGVVSYLEQVELSDALENDEHKYFIVRSDSGVIDGQGEIMDALDEWSNGLVEFNVYREKAMIV